MSDVSNAGPAPHSLGQGVEQLRAKSAAIIAFGVLLIVLGLAALTFTIASTVASVTLNGVLFLVAGGAEIGIGMHSRGWGRFFLWVIGGLIYLAAGLFCVINPLLASVVLTLALGVGLIAAGLVRAILAWQLPPGESRIFVLIASAATLLLGAIIVAHWPFDSLFVLGTLLGVDLLLHGAGWTSFGFALRARR